MSRRHAESTAGEAPLVLEPEWSEDAVDAASDAAAPGPAQRPSGGLVWLLLLLAAASVAVMVTALFQGWPVWTLLTTIGIGIALAVGASAQAKRAWPSTARARAARPSGRRPRAVAGESPVEPEAAYGGSYDDDSHLIDDWAAAHPSAGERAASGVVVEEAFVDDSHLIPDAAGADLRAPVQADDDSALFDELIRRRQSGH